MKLTIGSLDDLSIPAVEAHYNPKEIDLGKTAAWKDPQGLRPVTQGNYDLEYTGAPPRTMALELLFDGYEADTSIEPIIAALDRLASPVNEDGTKYDVLRPHVCIAVWNDKELPRFQCVIESLAVKYTMFSRAGKPLRATVQIKLKEIRPKRARRGDWTRFAKPTREELDKQVRGEADRGRRMLGIE